MIRESSNPGFRVPPTPSPKRINYWTPRHELRWRGRPLVAARPGQFTPMRLAFPSSLQRVAERRLGHVAHDRVRVDAAVGFDKAAFLACVSPSIAAARSRSITKFYNMLGFVDSHSSFSQRGRSRPARARYTFNLAIDKKHDSRGHISN